MGFQKIVIDGGFGIDHLKTITAEVPEPGPGYVLVKIHAVSLNFRDLMMIEGFYNPKQPLPLVPCSDGVGVVAAVGPGVTRSKVGDRVCTTFFERWIDGRPDMSLVREARGGPLDGTLAEYALVREEGLVAAPAHLSDVEASTLTCAAVTAWTALVTTADLRPGDTVLLLGTGGVSTFALQFAKIFGLKTIVTSSSDAKLAKAVELGADMTINYRTEPQWGRAVKKLTGGRGVDLVVEVGGAGTLNQSLGAITIGGQIALIGVLSGAVTDLNVVRIFMAGAKVQGIFVGHRAAFEAMNRALELHQMRPLIDSVFTFAQAPEAFAYLKEQRHQGKVVVQMG